MAVTFWFVLTIFCVVWYSAVTFYVGYKGAKDIRGMLSRLSANKDRTTPNAN